MAKSVKSTKEKAIEAALALAAEKGWENVSLRDISKKAKIPLSALHDQFEDRLDILTAFSRSIDRRVLDGLGDPDPSLSPRERLFDILMERFDILNGHRNAVRSILSSLRGDPKQAVISLPWLCRSMSWMLDAAGIDTGGVKGGLRIAGLTALYLKTLWVWRDDDSEDLSRTMAALDRNLDRAENWAASFGLGEAR